MADDAKAGAARRQHRRLLEIGTWASVAGIALGVLDQATVGVIVLVAGVGLLTVGIHRLGRDGPAERLDDLTRRR